MDPGAEREGTLPEGFTLIELLIVMAILAIIAAITIPNLLASKQSTNETAAIATLRHIVSSQAMASVSAKIDADNDGKGEYGTFLEMSGAVGVRKGFAAGSPPSADFSVKGIAIEPPVLSSAFAQVDAQGFTTKAGYAFMIFLPDSAPTASFVHETNAGGMGAGLAGGTGRVGVDASETAWCAYARPMLLGGTGSRQFFTYQKGDILQSSNEVARGQGVASPPAANAAFLGAGITAPVAVGTKGNDGDVWKAAQ
jgi:type IV pilus assembly protein PilA